MNWLRNIGSMVATVVVSISALATPVNAQNKELNLFAWSEYVPQTVIDGFTKETGIKVNYETYASNEEMLSKLLAGASQYDLIQPSEYVIEALIKADRLVALDHSKLPNLKNLDPEFTRMPHDAGNKYCVPWMSGTVGIVVNTDKIKDKVETYADVFQQKNAGRIVVLDDSRELVTWALAHHGKAINDVTPENLKLVRPTLEQWMKLVKVYDSDSPKTALINGDVDIGIVWSGEAALLWVENQKFKYVIPSQGAHQFIDSLAIPKGSPNSDAAHLFINYILRPEVSAIISEEFPYTNPNAEARKLLTDAQRSNPASYPPAGSKLEIFHDIGPIAAEIDKLITELKAK